MLDHHTDAAREIIAVGIVACLIAASEEVRDLRILRNGALAARIQPAPHELEEKQGTDSDELRARRAKMDTKLGRGKAPVEPAAARGGK